MTIMKKIFFIAITICLISLPGFAQEEGDVPNEAATFQKMLNNIQKYSLTQPGITTPAKNSYINKHTGQFTGTCEKQSVVCLTALYSYKLNGKNVQTNLTGYATFDKNANGTWSAPGWDLEIPPGAIDASLSILLDSYTLIPKGGILMNRTMPNRYQGFKIRLPLVVPKVIKSEMKVKSNKINRQ